MAKCPDCGLEMNKADGCTCAFLKVGSRGVFKRKKYGGPAERCHGCGARKGYYHHAGCDMEQCPICGKQAIGCGCYGKGDIKGVKSMPAPGAKAKTVARPKKSPSKPRDPLAFLNKFL